MTLENEHCTYCGSQICPTVSAVFDSSSLEEGVDFTVEYGENTNAGTGTVRVMGLGEFRGTEELEFTIDPKEVTVTAANLSKAVDEDDPKLTASVTGLLGDDTVLYTLSREPGEAVGTYAIEPSGDGIQGNYQLSFVPGTLTITSPISRVTIAAIEDQEYCGEGIKPKLTVNDGEAELKADVDYEVAYRDNKDVGQAKVTLTGIGVYTGTTEVTFQIVPRPVMVQAPSVEKTYGEDDPDLVPTIDGLLKGDEIAYDVMREPGESIGEYEVSVRGEELQGNYRVSFASGTLTIQRRKATVTADRVTKAYGDDDPELTATVEGVLEGDVLEYTLSREAGESLGAYPVAVTGKEAQGNYIVSYAEGELVVEPRLVKVTVLDATKKYGEPDPTFEVKAEGLLAGDTVSWEEPTREAGEDTGTYEVVASGEGLQGNYRVTYVLGTLTIVGTSLSGADVAAVADMTYEGTAVEPKPEVTLNGRTLVLGTDYTLSYRDNVDAGEATLVVSGVGNFEGTVESTFKILPRDVTVAAGKHRKQYGEPDPAFDATEEGLLGEDSLAYEMSREEGEGVGTYAVTPHGEELQGNYCVSFEPGELTIEPRSATVRVNAATKQYGADDPAFTAEEEGVLGEDSLSYAVSRQPGEDVGTYRIDAVGEELQGNYRVSFEPGELTIRKASIASATVSKIEEQAYSSGGVKPNPTVQLHGKTLIKDRDYQLSYSNNQSVGTGIVYISGIGNYTGTLSRTFSIVYKLVKGTDTTIGQALGKGKSLSYSFDVEKNCLGYVRVVISGRYGEVEVSLTRGGNAVYGWKVSSNGGPSYVSPLSLPAGTYTMTISSTNATTVVESLGWGTLSRGYGTAYIEHESPDNDPESIQIGEPVLGTMMNSVGSIGILDADSFVFDLNGPSDVSLIFVSDITSVLVNNDLCVVELCDTAGKVIKRSDGSLIQWGGLEDSKGTVKKQLAQGIFDCGHLKAGTYRVVVSANLVCFALSDSALTQYIKAREAGLSYTLSVDAAVSIEGAYVSVAKATYTGSPLTPNVRVSLNGKTLTQDVDYSVRYSRNTDAGRARVVVSGKGIYTGTISEYFTIEPASIDSVSAGEIDEQKYTGGPIRPQLSLTYGGNELKELDDYAAYYEDNLAVGLASIEIKGMGNFTGSKVLTFAITPASISEVKIEALEDQLYAFGNAVTPPLTMTFGGESLKAGIDYTVGFQNNTEMGTATIRIEGLGNYSGSRESTFEIVPIPTSLAQVGIVEDQLYDDGAAIKPLIVVTYGGKALIEGTDYTLEYVDNAEVGTATYIVTGLGVFTGTTKGTFRIVYPVDWLDVSAPASQTYTGKAITPVVVVSRNGNKLVKGADYNVTYANNTNAGTATATITGKGNYVGSRKLTFSISTAANKLSVKAKAKTVKVKLDKVKNAKVTLASNIKLANKGTGKLTYKNVSTKKASKSFKVNAKTGKLTVPKGTKKGTYTVKIKVTAAGNSNVKAGSKTVAYKVVVK